MISGKTKNKLITLVEIFSLNIFYYVFIYIYCYIDYINRSFMLISILLLPIIPAIVSRFFMRYRKELRKTSVILLLYLRGYTCGIFVKIFNNIGCGILKDTDWFIWDFQLFSAIAIPFLFFVELYFAFHPKKNNITPDKNNVEKIFKIIFYILIVVCVLIGFYFNSVGAELYGSKESPLYTHPGFFDMFLFFALNIHLLIGFIFGPT